MPFQTLSSMRNVRGPQFADPLTGQMPTQGQPVRPWNDPNNWGGGLGQFGGMRPPAPVGNPPFSGPFPVGGAPAPSGGLGTNPNPPMGTLTGPQFNGNPAPVIPPVQGMNPVDSLPPGVGQRPVLGSFDTLKGKKKITRGGLYKLKAGESVSGVTSLASLRHAR